MLRLNYLACAQNVANRDATDAMGIRLHHIEVKQRKLTFMHLVAFIMKCVSSFLKYLARLSDNLYRYSLMRFLFRTITDFKSCTSSQTGHAQHDC